MIRNSNGKSRAILIGIILLFFGVVCIIFTSAVMKDGEGLPETEATIFKIKYDFMSENYTVIMIYELDGETYFAPLNEYSSAFREGNKLTIKYDPSDPTRIFNADMTVSYIFIAVGAILTVASVAVIVATVLGIKRFKNGVIGSDSATPFSDGSTFFSNGGTEQNFTETAPNFTQAEATAPDFEEKLSNAGLERFSYRIDGDYKSFDHVLSDKFNQVVYEAKCEKCKLLKASDYAFYNRKDGTTSNHTVSVTVTSTNAFNAANPVNSSFKIDGENVWNVLNSMGVTVKTLTPNNFALAYEVWREGKQIAFITGQPSYDDVYRFKRFLTVYARPDSLDYAFLAVFAISRTQTEFIG